MLEHASVADLMEVARVFEGVVDYEVSFFIFILFFI
jgi:hypothetical protein